MIKISNLKKIYETNVVLDIDQLDIEKGKIYVLVGHNGAGKTTLLRLINGLEKPSTGYIVVDVNQRQMVLCFQKPYMFQGTVQDNILYGIKLRKRKAQRCLDKDLINRLGLSHLLDRNAKNLSAGETQRTALARALILKPDLLLLDEPTANLDPESRETIEKEIIQQNLQGVTIINATHIPRQIYKSIRIIRLEKGKLTHSQLNNIFEGDIIERSGNKEIKINDKIHFPLSTQKNGHVRIAIPDSDIILSAKEMDPGMLNQFPGKVISINQHQDEIEIKVDIGIALAVVVTPTYFFKMNITVGSVIFLSFNAMSIKVF